MGGNRAIHRTPSHGEASTLAPLTDSGKESDSVSGAVFIPLCPLRALRRFLLSRQSQTYKSEEVSRLSSDDDEDDDDL